MNIKFESSIRIAERFKPFFEDYCKRIVTGSVTSFKQSPFQRNIDIWFMAICFAVDRGLTPVEEIPGKKWDAIPGSVINEYMTTILCMLAISHTNDVEIVGDPSQVLRIANSYAYVGLDSLESICKNGDMDPLFAVCDEIEARFSTEG